MKISETFDAAQALEQRYGLQLTGLEEFVLARVAEVRAGAQWR